MTILELRDFLKELEAKIAPPSGHHALHFRHTTSDDRDRLALSVRLTERINMTYFLNADDFEKTREALVAEIAADALKRREGLRTCQSG